MTAMVQSCVTKTRDFTSEMVQVEGIKSTRGRPKLNQIEIVRKDVSVCDLTTNIDLDRVEWH